MKKAARRTGTSRSRSTTRPTSLATLLADLRTTRRLTLREVEDATGKTVSNAYLSQLENGKIRKPSPNVLHDLADVYGVPYESLMEKAGYLRPAASSRGVRRRRLGAIAIADLTADEEEELLKYLAVLRSRGS
jgi:transcriptional regulator with XRE-family HTH domain